MRFRMPNSRFRTLAVGAAAAALVSLPACAGPASSGEPPASAPTADSAPAAGVMTVSPADQRPPTPGPAQNFVGEVSVTPLGGPTPPSELGAGQVTFSPGARSAWHTHPDGQLLIVTEGTGWVQQHGSPKQVMRTGDVVWTPAGVRHWHGATADTSVTHTAVQNFVDGSNATWMEQVSDAQYAG